MGRWCTIGVPTPWQGSQADGINAEGIKREAPQDEIISYARVRPLEDDEVDRSEVEVW